MLLNVNHVMKRIPKRGSHEIVDRKVDGCIKDLKKLNKGRYIHEPCWNSEETKLVTFIDWVIF